MQVYQTGINFFQFIGIFDNPDKPVVWVILIQSFAVSPELFALVFANAMHHPFIACFRQGDEWGYHSSLGIRFPMRRPVHHRVVEVLITDLGNAEEIPLTAVCHELVQKQGDDPMLQTGLNDKVQILIACFSANEFQKLEREAVFQPYFGLEKGSNADQALAILLAGQQEPDLPMLIEMSNPD